MSVVPLLVYYLLYQCLIKIGEGVGFVAPCPDIQNSCGKDMIILSTGLYKLYVPGWPRYWPY